MPTKTVLIGLGSNLEPLTNLRWALRELKRLEFVSVKALSAIYESDALTVVDSPITWQKKFLNAVALVEVENFDPEKLLTTLKNIEKKIGRKNTIKWAPREIDLDILYVEAMTYKSESLEIPHKDFFQRPFALLPALEVYPQLQGPKPEWANEWFWPKPFATHRSFDFFWPQLVGILNITYDSFSDGGQLNTKDAFKVKAEQLFKQGAEILDIGAESTRPGAKPVDSQTELTRLQSALKWLNELKLNVKISIDSRSPQVLTTLLDIQQIHFINDVTGFSQPDMLRVLAASPAQGVVMHSLGVPPIQNETLKLNKNPCQQLVAWWKEKTAQFKDYGICESKIIFDPGIGFGKTPQQNSYILNHLEEFTDIQSDIFLGFSRKSFLSQYTQVQAAERDTVTALQTAKLNWVHCQYLRTHDIESQKTALRMK